MTPTGPRSNAAAGPSLSFDRVEHADLCQAVFGPRDPLDGHDLDPAHHTFTLFLRSPMTEPTQTLADRVIGDPDGPEDARGLYDTLTDARRQLDELEAHLAERMQECAQAMYDDDSGAGERAQALRDVAELLGIEGPHSRLDRLYDDTNLDTGD